jgi:hypothetical protein
LANCLFFEFSSVFGSLHLHFSHSDFDNNICLLNWGNASHENWLETPSANGKERGDTEMRRLMPKYELPAYALKNGYQPSKQHQKFLKNYGEGRDMVKLSKPNC